MDVVSIDAGKAFMEAIEHAIDDSDVVLIVIGPGWESATDQRGDARLWDPADPVRAEIETALAADVRTIPVVVGGATMPTLDSVPESLRPLVGINAVELLDRRWAGDVADLVDVMHRRAVGRPSAGSLPSSVSSLIGRRELIEEVSSTLLDRRLLTLTGAGGSGKTRVALEVATRWRDDGRYAWFVGLAGARDATNTTDAVLTALGVTARGDEGLDAAVRSLRLHPGLLVVDNCEHVIEGVADLITRLVTGAPDVRVIATSREPLGLEGEWIALVPPLGLPSHSLSFDEASANESVRLFVDRASAAPGFSLTQGNLGAVVDICGRVDGLPLGIELAAARARSMSVHEIAAHLSQRHDLLSGGRGRGHHATMAAAIDWSVDLLTPEDRTLFERLAVFVAPFPIEGAESVGKGSGGGTMDVARGVASLVDKSLLTMESREIGTVYRYLEPVRQRAEVLLELDDEQLDVGEAHAAWVADLTERGEVGFRGPDQPVWMARLTASMPDIRKALAWLPATGGHSVYRTRIAGDIWWLTANLDADEWGPLPARVLETAVREDPSWPLLVAAAAIQAMFALELRNAEELALRALRSCPRSSLAAMVASTTIGSVQRERGEFEAALARHREDERLAHEALEPWWEARARYSGGLVHMMKGDPAPAREDLLVAMRGFAKLGEPSSVLDCCAALYGLAHLEGDEAAAVAAIESMDPWVEGALPESAAFATIARAELDLRRGEVTSALSGALTAVEQSMLLGTANDVSMNALEVVAACLAVEGRLELAVELVAAGESFLPMDKRFGSDVRRADREGLLVDARIALGPEAFTRAWRAGASARFEDLLATI